MIQWNLNTLWKNTRPYVIKMSVNQQSCAPTPVTHTPTPVTHTPTKAHYN